jgi:hypothetical protein
VKRPKPVHRSTFGSPYIAHRLYRLAVIQHGEDHPAARAAYGRWMACRGTVPCTIHGPAYVAWLREHGGMFAGYHNRHKRRRTRRQLAALAAAEGTNR